MMEETRESKKLTDRELMFKHFQSDTDFQKQVVETLKKIEDKLDENSETYILKRYQPILEAWEGLSFFKKFMVGTGALVSAIVTIGAAIWFIVLQVRGH